jgi:hypothetical protein
MTEEEIRIEIREKDDEMKKMLSLISLQPQIFQAEIGAEAFVKDFIKVFTKYIEYSKDEKRSMERLSEVIKFFPQVIRHGTGAETFLEDIRKASKRFVEYFEIPY